MSAYLCAALTSFGLEVGDAVHDDMVQEQRLVVDLDVSGEQAAEVLHIPEGGREGGGEEDVSSCIISPHLLQQKFNLIILCSSQHRDTTFALTSSNNTECS